MRLRDPAQRVYPPRTLPFRPPTPVFVKPEPPLPTPPAPRLGEAPSDLELLARWRAGDRKSGAALYERHAPKIRIALHRQCRNKLVVEDLVQESFEGLQGSKAAVEDVGAYLHRIAFYKFTRYLRAKNAPAEPCDPAELGETPDETDDPEHVTIAADERSDLLAAMDKLAPKYREVLTLVFWQDKTLPEVATILGLPLNTVTSRLRLAKERLAKAKRQLEAPPPPRIVAGPRPPTQPRSKLSAKHRAALARDAARAELLRRVADAARAGLCKAAAMEALGLSRFRLLKLLAEVPDAPRFADDCKTSAQRKERTTAKKAAAQHPAAKRGRPPAPVLPPRNKPPGGKHRRLAAAPAVDINTADGWVVIDAARCLVARVPPGLTATQALGRCVGMERAKAIGDRAADFYRRFHAEREGDTAVVSPETLAKMLGGAP